MVHSGVHRLPEPVLTTTRLSGTASPLLPKSVLGKAQWKLKGTNWDPAKTSSRLKPFAGGALRDRNDSLSWLLGFQGQISP